MVGVDVRVAGAEQLVALSRAVKAYADGPAIRKELLKGLRAAARPAADAIRDSYQEGLPHTGGLNEFVASAKFAPRTRTTGKSAGVRIQATKSGHDLEAVERGQIRRPTFGHAPWITQTVTAGLGDKALRESGPRTLADLKYVMDETASRIARSV